MFLFLAKHHTDDTVAAKSKVDRCSRFQHSLWHHSVFFCPPLGEILRRLLISDHNLVSANVPWAVLMSSHSRKKCGDTVDNGSPSSNLHYVPMTTEPSTHLALPSTHIYSWAVCRSEWMCQLKWGSFTVHGNSSPCMVFFFPLCTLIHSVHQVQVQWMPTRYNLSDRLPWVTHRRE